MSGNSAAGHVIRTLSPLAIADLRCDERFDLSPLLRDHDIVSALIVPLLGPSRPFGVLNAFDVSSYALRMAQPSGVVFDKRVQLKTHVPFVTHCPLPCKEEHLLRRLDQFIV